MLMVFLNYRFRFFAMTAGATQKWNITWSGINAPTASHSTPDKLEAMADKVCKCLCTTLGIWSFPMQWKQMAFAWITLGFFCHLETDLKHSPSNVIFLFYGLDHSILLLDTKLMMFMHVFSSLYSWPVR